MPSRITISLILLFCSPSFLVLAFAGSDNDDYMGEDFEEENSIQICCTWGSDLQDGKLSYSIDDEESTREQQDAVRNAIEEWELPYRNRYGALTDDPNDKWGYKFRNPVDGVIKSVWLERFGPRVDFLNESTFKGLMFASEISQKAPEEQLHRSV